MAAVIEIHHRVPRYLLSLFDRAASGEFDAKDLQALYEWEEEAFRYSTDPDISRADPAPNLFLGRTDPADHHRAEHFDADGNSSAVLASTLTFVPT